MMGVLAIVSSLMTVSRPIGTKQEVDQSLAENGRRGACN